MAGITIDGLVSGLQTGDIIQKLMEVERLPIKRMEEKKKAYQEKITLLQGLSEKLSTLKLAVDNLRTSSLYRSRTATSSNESVLKATAQPGAPTGRYTLQVEQIALAHQLASNAVSDPTSRVFGTGTITIQVGSGTPVTVDITDTSNSLEGIRNAINNAGLPLSATVVGGEGEYRLVLLSRNTGEAGEITVTIDLSGGTETLSFSTIQPPQNAQVLLGTSSPIVFEFSSNTVTTLLPGVTLNLLASSSTPVTVEVTEDTTLLKDQIQRFVESYNDVVNTIKDLTRYDPDTGDKGAFLGDVNLSIVRSQLERVITSAVSGVPEAVNSLAMLGLKLSKTGVLQIEDPRILEEKLSANLEGVEELFVQGVARNLSDIIRNATSYGGGILWIEQNMYQNLAKDIDERIATLEEAMALREKRLWRQFTSLETFLSNMQSQSTWLANQIARLNNQTQKG